MFNKSRIRVKLKYETKNKGETFVLLRWKRKFKKKGAFKSIRINH